MKIMKKLGKIFQQRKNKKTEVESAQQDKNLVGGEDNGITLNAVDTAQTNDDYSCLRQVEDYYDDDLSISVSNIDENGVVNSPADSDAVCCSASELQKDDDYSCLRQVEDYQDDQSISESDKKTGGVADFSIVDDSTATLDDEQQTDRNTQAANSRSKENNKENPSSQPSNNSNGDITNSVVIGGNLFGLALNIVRNGVSKLWVKNKIEESDKKNEIERAKLETRIEKYLLIKIAESKEEIIKEIKGELDQQIKRHNDFESAIKATVANLSDAWGRFSDDIIKRLEKVENLDSQVANASKILEEHKVRIDALEDRQIEFMNYAMTYFDSLKNSLEKVSNKTNELEEEVRRLKKELERIKKLIEELYKSSQPRDPCYEICPRCGSYHSFDIYVEGKKPYYICAVCGRKDNDDEDKRKIINDDKSINPELHVLESSVLDDSMNEHNLTSLKRVLVKNNTQKIGTSQGGSAINIYYGELEVFSLSNPNEKGEPYYTLGKGLFDFSNNQKWIKLYGMKYVNEIENSCFKGIKKEEREAFWDDNGFTLAREDRYFC